MPATKPKKSLGNMIKASAKGAPASVKAAPAPPSVPPPQPQAAKPASVSTGRPAAVWFDDEDRAILRELSVLLLNHGTDPTHSLLVRALLRLAPRDERLIEQVRELLDRDGRKLRHRQAAVGPETSS